MPNGEIGEVRDIKNIDASGNCGKWRSCITRMGSEESDLSKARIPDTDDVRQINKWLKRPKMRAVVRIDIPGNRKVRL